jgi:hypothetical protein
MARNLVVNGTVTEAGAGLSGVSITLKDMLNGNTQVASTQTGANGSYSVTGTFQTDSNNKVKCKVTASKSGFKSRSKSRTTTSASITVDFGLDPTFNVR